MEKAKKNILILEDDASLNKALSEAVNRAGFQAFSAMKPDEATVILNSQNISFMIVDCLLPQMTGVDFVQRYQKQNPNRKVPSVLTSGVFTDKVFIKEAMQKTGAVAVLKKPFNLKEVLQILNESIATTSGGAAESSPRKNLYQLLGRTNVTNRQKRKAIENLEEVDGFDLPLIFTLLVESHATGHLNMVRSGSNEVLGVSFSDGVIVGVDVNDQESYLGKLLIDRGYISRQELESTLKDNSPRKIGEKLIGENLLSPHAFDIILAEQMNIRLSKTIQKGSVKVNFVSSDVERRGAEIDQEALLFFLHDWIVSKMSTEWLKTQYRSWGDNLIKLGPSFTMTHPGLKTPLMQGLSQFVNYLTSGKSLNQLFDSSEFPEDQAYKALHFLLTAGLVMIDEKISEETDQQRLARLKKIVEQMKGKNQFEIFEIMGGRRNAKEDENKVVYDDFIKTLGADPSGAPASKPLATIYKDLSERAKDAYTIVNDKSQRENYEKDLVQVEMDKKLKIQAKYEEAKVLLTRSQFQKALEALKTIPDGQNFENFRLHFVWAKVGMIELTSDKNAMIKDIDYELMQVPPEEKYGALFSYVSGLYQKTLGNTAVARKHLEKALAVDPSMMAAKRELNLLILNDKKKKDLLNMDLSQVVGTLFKRTK